MLFSIYYFVTMIHDEMKITRTLPLPYVCASRRQGSDDNKSETESSRTFFFIVKSLQQCLDLANDEISKKPNLQNHHFPYIYATVLFTGPEKRYFRHHDSCNIVKVPSIASSMEQIDCTRVRARGQVFYNRLNWVAAGLV